MKKAVTLAIVVALIITISIASVIVIQYAFTNNWYNYTANVKSQQLEREALTFIKNIWQLDYTKYYGQVGDLPNPENPYSFQYLINYQNNTKLSTYEKYRQMLTINYMDINHTDISFDVGTLDGLISYHDEGNSVIDQARGILDRYQTAYNASYVQDFLNSLDSYSTVTNSSQQIGDFRIDMHSAYGEETITWSRAVNSIPNSRDVIS